MPYAWLLYDLGVRQLSDITALKTDDILDIKLIHRRRILEAADAGRGINNIP